MKLDAFVYVLVCLCDKIRLGADAFQVTALAAPDRNRCSPVSVTGNRPILNILKPVSETLFAYKVRIPVYLVVVFNKLIS